MSSALRKLFIIIILFCLPSNPVNLFEIHYMEWTDDFFMSASERGKTCCYGCSKKTTAMGQRLKNFQTSKAKNRRNQQQ